MWKKLMASIAGSILVSSCQTAMYKPIICKPGTALREGKCQKVASTLIDAPKAKAKKKAQTTAPSQLFSQPAPSFIPPMKRDNGYTK